MADGTLESRRICGLGRPRRASRASEKGGRHYSQYLVKGCAFHAAWKTRAENPGHALHNRHFFMPCERGGGTCRVEVELASEPDGR